MHWRQDLQRKTLEEKAILGNVCRCVSEVWNLIQISIKSRTDWRETAFQLTETNKSRNPFLMALFLQGEAERMPSHAGAPRPAVSERVKKTHAIPEMSIVFITQGNANKYTSAYKITTVDLQCSVLSVPSATLDRACARYFGRKSGALHNTVPHHIQTQV